MTILVVREAGCYMISLNSLVIFVGLILIRFLVGFGEIDFFEEFVVVDVLVDNCCYEAGTVVLLNLITSLLLKDFVENFSLFGC